MKILLETRLHSFLLSMFGMLALSSCVNEEYDFSKEIDTEVTILKNVSMPIGSVEKITISELLTLEDDESVIRTDDQGNFIFSFSGSDITAELDVPSFSIASDAGIHTEPLIVHFNTGSAAGKNPSQVPEDIVYSKISGGVLSTSLPMAIDTELPTQIADIKSIGLNASCYMNFSVSGGSVYLKSGFVFEFPSAISLNAGAYTDVRFELIDNHKLRAKQDVKISPASPLTFALVIDKFNLPAGAVSNGRLNIDEELKVTGDLYISPSDYTVIPDKLSIQIKADISDLDVLTAEVKLAVDETVKGDVLEISDLPDFLSGGDICLDIYNPSLNFNVNNSTPFGFGVHAAVKAANGDKSVNITIGDDPAINIPAGTQSKYVISRRENPAAGVTNIVVPEIGDLISMMPKTISFDEIRVQSPVDEYVTIASGQNYEASISYEVYAPLAFDKNLNIHYVQDVDNIGFELDDINAETLKITLSIVNTIPLDFNINAKPLDADGNVIEDVTLSIENNIKAGTLDAPAQSDIALSMTSSGKTFGFDGLRLDIKAVCPSEDMYGVALNINNSIEITNISLSCPEGVTVNM